MLGFIIFLIFCGLLIIFIMRLIKEDYKAINKKPDKTIKPELDKLNKKFNPSENKKDFEELLNFIDSFYEMMNELPLRKKTREQLKISYACYGKETNEVPFSKIIQSDIIYMLIKARMYTITLNIQDDIKVYDFFDDIFPEEIISIAKVRILAELISNHDENINDISVEETLPSMVFLSDFISDMSSKFIKDGIIEKIDTDGPPSWATTVISFINDLITSFFEYGKIPAEDFEYQKAMKCLAELLLFSTKHNNIISNTNRNNNNEISITETKQLNSKSSSENNVDLNTLIKELNSLTGLTKVKEEVNTLINLVKIRKLRESQGLKQIPLSLHLVFSGNPGTGKTTVARLLAKIYKQLGVLSKGQLIETDRSGLVAGYVGQTALKTQEVIEKAKGGILFIDEAYSLTSSSDSNDFGKEAVDTLLKAMEDMREDFIVIVAGYPDLMKQFLKSNPGLESRFNNFIDFEDYQPEDLFEIFKSMCKEKDFIVSENLNEPILNYFDNIYINKDDSYANARTVRNFFEKAIKKQTNRIAKLDNPSKKDLQELLYEDLF